MPQSAETCTDTSAGLRHDWRQDEVEALFALPFTELIFRAQSVHRRWFDPRQVQCCELLSIKTGGCPEDCGYCSQSRFAKSGVKASKLMAVAGVLAAAKRAKANGASRYCLGAAWRSPKDKDLAPLAAMIAGIKALGMETCATLGMLTRAQAAALADAGLDYYNHNIDTSPEFYDQIITTRQFQERLDTLEHVRAAGIKVCCGGIVGMGESVADRAAMLRVLANLPHHPESVPINQLIAIRGTALEGQEKPHPIDFVRCLAVARILMPRSAVRLSAGRDAMSDEMQALCFLAGANSIFIGSKLLTADNPEQDQDQLLLARLGLEALPAFADPLQEPANP